MKKATLNYWGDMAIGAAFAVSAVSGLVFLLPAQKNTVLGIGLATWDLVHIWASLAMIVGVLAHLVLHWNWIACMTRKNLAVRAKASRAAERPEGTLLGRRRFLNRVGIMAVCAVLPALLLRALTDDVEASAEAALPSSSSSSSASAVAVPSVAATAAASPTVQAQPTASEAATTIETPVQAAPTAVAGTALLTGPVASRNGIRYDPYPGRCRLYVDKDGDGYCDYSIPSS